MARQPKPFPYRGWWRTKVGGKLTKLAPLTEPRKTAVTILRELLLKRDQGLKSATALAVWELCDQFLDFVKLNRADRTFEFYKERLEPWVALHGKELARNLTALDLERWKAELVKQGYAPFTVNHGIVAVQTCWNWGVKMDLLFQNPFRKVEKLDAEGRERILLPEEFSALLRVSDKLFRQVLLVFRLTGVRPSEFCGLTWGQVNWKAHCWVIRKHKARRRSKVKKPRIILMTPIVENLLRWRLRKLGYTPDTMPDALRSQPVFLNRLKKRWTTNALRCRMRRARVEAKIKPDENGEQIVMYTNRHTFATEAIASGAVTDRRLGDLMGHTPGSKSTQRYIHLATSDLYRAAVDATRGYMSPKVTALHSRPDLGRRREFIPSRRLPFHPRLEVFPGDAVRGTRSIGADYEGSQFASPDGAIYLRGRKAGLLDDILRCHPGRGLCLPVVIRAEFKGEGKKRRKRSVDIGKQF